MTVDERARAGLFLAMQYPVEVPGVSVSNFLRTAKTALDGEAPKLRTWVKDVNDGARAARHRPDVRAAHRQRGLLRRREEAPRDRPARAAQPEVRDPRRDRLRPRHRRAQGRLRGRQPVPRAGGQGRPADHPLHPDPALHRARLRARLRRRPDRRAGRPRARRGARGRGLRQVPHGRRSDHVPDAAARAPPRAGGRSARTSRSSSATLADGQPLVYLDSANTSQKPPGRHRRDGRPPRAAQRQRRPRHAPARRGVDRGVRGRAATRSRRSSTRRPATRSIFTKNASEALNLVANTLAWARGRCRSARATRSSSPRWSTTPTSCRGSCSPSAPARRCAGSGSPTTAGSTCRTSTS